MAMVHVLLFFSTAFLLLAAINAAPTRYDQRQDGDFNLHAQLENFLFVVAIPSNNDLLNELALQALELKQQLVSRASTSSLSKNPVYNSSEEAHGEEPYSLEIVRIDGGDRPDKEDPSRKTEAEKNTENSPNQRQVVVTLTSIGTNELGKKAESVTRTARGFDLMNKRQMPVILGHLVDTRKTLGAKMEIDDRARNIVGNVWNPDVESGRPGALLKKQLFRQGDISRAENVALSSNTDKNDITFSEEKQEELRLLGDGIENCGPGRRRDASGVCQFDETTASLL